MIKVPCKGNRVGHFESILMDPYTVAEDEIILELRGNPAKMAIDDIADKLGMGTKRVVDCLRRHGRLGEHIPFNPVKKRREHEVTTLPSVIDKYGDVRFESAWLPEGEGVICYVNDVPGIACCKWYQALKSALKARRGYPVDGVSLQTVKSSGGQTVPGLVHDGGVGEV